MIKKKQLKSVKFLLLCLLTIMSLALGNEAMAKANLSKPATRASQNQLKLAKDLTLSRGEATDLVVKYFDLEGKNQKFLTECDALVDQCLFAFIARTNFSELKLKPLILYPDVFPKYKYYKSINLASKLDLVSGYFKEKNSPYKPKQKITKIEALKLVLGASGLLKWKDKFEIDLDKTGQEKPANWFDQSQLLGEEWWYQRYIFNAVEKGILADTTAFDSKAEITKTELQLLMNKSKEMLANQ